MADFSSTPPRPPTRPKYVQIRPEQWNRLDELARALQDARTQKVERITSNTLIRVAIDALLEHEDLLTGNTEAELRTNLLARLQRRPSLE
jgi:hypothetical protein